MDALENGGCGIVMGKKYPRKPPLFELRFKFSITVVLFHFRASSLLPLVMWNTLKQILVDFYAGMVLQPFIQMELRDNCRRQERFSVTFLRWLLELSTL